MLIFFSTVMFVLIFMSGMFVSAIMVDRYEGNTPPKVHYWLAFITGGLGIYYIVTLIGMAASIQ